MAEELFYTPADEFAAGDTPTAAEWNERVFELPSDEFIKRDSWLSGAYTLPTLTEDNVGHKVDITGLDVIFQGHRLATAGSISFVGASNGTYYLMVDADNVFSKATSENPAKLTLGTAVYDTGTIATPTVTVELLELGGGGAVTSVNSQTGDVVLGAADVSAEPALGNPGTTGYVLSSTDAGVRSWIAPAEGAVTSVNSETGEVELDAADVGAEPALGDPATSGQVLASTDAGVRSWVDIPVVSVNSATGEVELDAGDVGAEPALGNPGTTGFVLSSTDAGVRSWVELPSASAVTSVNSETGDVVLGPDDVGAIDHAMQFIYLTGSNSDDDYTLTVTPAFGSYQTGMCISFKFAAFANAGSVTLNVCSLGAKTLKKLGGTANLAAGDVAAYQMVYAIYDGTYFQMVNPPGQAQAPAAHNHDDRYYTESEVNALLTGYQSVVNLVPNPYLDRLIGGVLLFWLSDYSSTAATLLLDTAEAGYGDNSLKITAGEDASGVKLTLKHLKPSTTYTVSARVKVTAGDTATLTTTGGDSNASASSTSTTWETISDTFATDATPIDVVIHLQAANNTDVVWFGACWATEGEISTTSAVIRGRLIGELNIAAGAWDYPAANPAPLDTDTGTNGTVKRQLHDATTEEFVIRQDVLPSTFDASYPIYWASRGYAVTAAASKNIVLKDYFAGYAAGETWDGGYTTVTSPDTDTQDSQDIEDIVVNYVAAASHGLSPNDILRSAHSKLAAGSNNLPGDWGRTMTTLYYAVRG